MESLTLSLSGALIGVILADAGAEIVGRILKIGNVVDLRLGLGGRLCNGGGYHL